MISRLAGVLLLLAAVAGAADAQGGDSQRAPYVGYVYPAGGRQGSTFQVMVGGQYLTGVNQAYISGAGVRASVVEKLPPFRPLKGEAVRELAQQLRQRIAELSGAGAAPPPPAGGRAVSPQKPAAQAGGKTAPDQVLPDLSNLTLPTLQELRTLLQVYFNPRSRGQTRPQLSDMVVLAVTLDPDAPPGDRELRLITPLGLTNPVCFQVGTFPETAEQEPNSRQDPAAAPLDLPVVLNGQITPGDVDCFRVQARQGQKLLMRVQARRLIPYLADAVPGWFQATLALYDPQGKEVAYDDDYRFDPDPVLFYQVPQDGVYLLEIHDSLYRGREDFVYRITVGEQPFVTSLFPLGGGEGLATTAAVGGWNLPTAQVHLDTSPGAGLLRYAAWLWPGGLSNRLLYAVDNLPESMETEPNDTAAEAQRVTLPQTLNGRIARPGDADVFRFEGQAGQEVVAEVYARRLGSPLDSLLRLSDASGKVLAWNDDQPDPEFGLLTDQADSYLRYRLPAAGAYYVQLSDAQHHGGEEYAYRLRLSAPRPDFALRATPAGLTLPAGRTAAFTVHVIRKDGFDGDVEVALSGAPAGFALSGGRIPAGRNQVRMTLTAPPQPAAQPVALHLQGQAQIGAAAATRPVVPAQDMMQAFAYHHLVPAQEFLALVTRARRFVPYLRLASSGVVRLPAGGTAQVPIRAVGAPGVLQQTRFELDDPPAGVSLEGVNASGDGWVLVLKADAQAAKAGYADNLIVEAFADVEIQRQGGAGNAIKRRVSLGVLPAISFEIVQQ